MGACRNEQAAERRAAEGVRLRVYPDGAVEVTIPARPAPAILPFGAALLAFARGGGVRTVPGAKERDPQRAGPDAPAVPDLGDVAQMAAEAGEAMSAGADAPAPVYGWSQGSATTRHSGDGRFTVEAHKGPVFKAYDAWTGEESRIYSDEAAALAWCRERIPADALAWTDYGAAHVTELSGSKFVVTVLGVDRPRFYATDVRLPVGSRERSSPIFDALETAKRWCEVRACCAVAPGLDPDRPALAYQSPVAF